EALLDRREITARRSTNIPCRARAAVAEAALAHLRLKPLLHARNPNLLASDRNTRRSLIGSALDRTTASKEQRRTEKERHQLGAPPPIPAWTPGNAADPPHPVTIARR